MRKFRISVIALLLSVVALAATIDTSNALYTSLFTVSNPGSPATDTLVFFPISGQSLSDNGFIDSDTLNSAVGESSTESIPGQPPSLRQSMLSAQADDGGVFTDETTASNNDTPNDMTLLPATVAASDAYYFGGNFPFRILTLNVTTAGEGDWAGTWEYWNGSAWQNLLNIDDRTDGFTVSGFRTVSFDLPTNWAIATVNTVDAYYIRYIVDSVTTTITQPLGGQSWWETGYWITYVASLEQNEQVQYTAYMGGIDIVENHQFFPGDDGYVTPDDPAIELGLQSYALTIQGFFNTSSTSGNFLTKTSAITIDNPNPGEIRLTIDDGVTTGTASVTGVDSGFYSVIVSSDQINTTLTVSGQGSDSTTSLDISDNANNWIWGDGDTILYFDSINISFPSINEEWTSSGQMALGGTLTGVMEYKDWNETNIGQLATPAPTGAVWVSPSYCYTTSTGPSLICVDDADATTIDSSCVLSTTGAQALTHDGTNFWAAHTTDTDIHEWTVGCVDTSNFNISAVSSSTMGLVWNGDTSRLALFSFVAGNPTLSIYQTSGVQDSTNTITAMSTASDEIIVSAEYFDGFYYVVATDGSSLQSYSLWRMTDSTDAVRIWNIDNDRYGYNSSNSASDPTFIQPTGSPFISGALAYDGIDWYFYNITSVNDSVQEESVIKYADIDSWIQIANDWCTNLVDWSSLSCSTTDSSRSGLNSAVVAGVLNGTYSVAMTVNVSGTEDTQQNTAAGSITEGLVYSFGVESFCGGETARLEIDWRDSAGVQIGATLTDSASSCGAFTELSIENQTAPALADHVTVRLEYQCVGACSGSDISYFDCVQAVQNTAIETPCATTSTNLVSNESFEQLYRTVAVGTNLWESDSISLSTVTDVFSSTIIWGETTPDDSSILIETSINGGVDWSEPVNGESIPGISPNDDLTGVSLLIRGTFTPSTDQEDSPQLDSMSIQVVDETGYALDYAPQQFIGLTLDDLTPNGNDATTSFPVPTGYTTSVGPLVPTGNVAPVEGSQGSPDVIGNTDGGTIITDPNTISLPSNFPFRDIFISFAEMGDIPVILPIVMLALLFILFCGLSVYSATGSIAAATFGLILSTLAVTSVTTGVFPIWILIFFAVGAIGMLVWGRIGSISV